MRKENDVKGGSKGSFEGTEEKHKDLEPGQLELHPILEFGTP
jgi:hypothetical protein